MFKSLIKYSFRALRRQKSYVIINIIGLAVGIVCSLIIGLFIIHELSYDRFNVNRDHMYRMVLHGKLGGQELTVSSTCAPLGPSMKNEIPEVEDFCRLNGSGETTIRYENESFAEKDYLQADSNFFSFFTVPLIRGNATTVLNQPHTVVLTQGMATKIFKDEDPIDKMIKIGLDSTYYRVTGIMEEIPATCHFRANMISSFMTNKRSDDKEWTSNSFDTYVSLHPGASTQEVNVKVKDLVRKYVGPQVLKYFGITLDEFLSQGNVYDYYLQALLKVHLDPSIQQDLKPANDPKYLLIFGSVGILILVIAAVNFMNLSTAQASRRAKEVGIKKVSGSSRNMLVLQFLIETFVLAFIALVLAVLIAELTLPYFDKLLGVKLRLELFSEWYTVPALLLLTLLIGVMAGSYPAFYLSSFNPYQVLKGERIRGRGTGRLRNVLVVIQFTISIILIVGTIVMYRQIRFMQDKPLGFDKENVIVLSNAEFIGTHMDAFKDALLRIPGVKNVTASTAIPGRNNNNNGYVVKGREQESYLLQTNWVDYDYLETYGIKLDSGRFFDPSMPTDQKACILNEAAVRQYNFKKPFDIRFLNNMGMNGADSIMPVIGVVSDFNFESLKNRIGPYMMQFRNSKRNWGYVSIRLAPEAGRGTIDEIEKTWASFTNNEPMQSFYLDKDFDRLFKEDRQNASLSVLFAIIGILIAAIGLFGLTTFSVRQRVKEMGVRKTFGAGVLNIWYLIAREIMVLVGIATLLAIPLIYWIADNWLQNYEYRIKLDFLDFAAGFVIAIVIALLTISQQALRTARANPSEALRYE